MRVKTFYSTLTSKWDPSIDAKYTLITDMNQAYAVSDLYLSTISRPVCILYFARKEHSRYG